MDWSDLGISFVFFYFLFLCFFSRCFVVVMFVFSFFFLFVFFLFFCIESRKKLKGRERRYVVGITTL